MANPWLKKNPFMSMWLSGANAAVGRARSARFGGSRQTAGRTYETDSPILDRCLAVGGQAERRRRQKGRD